MLFKCLISTGNFERKELARNPLFQGGPGGRPPAAGGEAGEYAHWQGEYASHETWAHET